MDSMIQVTSQNLSGIAITLLAAADVIAVAAFLVLADLTQLFIQFPRAVTMIVWRYRKAAMIVAVICFAAGLYIGVVHAALSGTVLVLNGILFIALFAGGYINVPYLMFRPQQRGAKYISVNEARKYLKPASRVMVVEVNGDARAFLHDWIARPHIAGEIIGGEEVVLTYCSLSHLGMAYSPQLGDKKLDLKVMLQLENNLVMFDEGSNQPVQQIRGTLEYSGERLKKYPTQVMPFDSFTKIYPKGRVFHNPPGGWWDRMVRAMVLDVTERQYTTEKAAFPTITHLDNRLPAKEMVYGIVINGAARAYSRDFLKQNSLVSISPESPDGQEIVMVYYPEFDTVAAFACPAGEKVTAVDIYGNSPAGKLDRIPVDSEVLWMIWSNFHPDTALNDQGAG